MLKIYEFELTNQNFRSNYYKIISATYTEGLSKYNHSNTVKERSIIRGKLKRVCRGNERERE